MKQSKFDVLEVVFFHAPSSNHARTLSTLQSELEPRFEVEALELVKAPVDCSRQVVRIASAMGEQFDSAALLEAEVRELAGGGYLWARVGAIRAGQGAAMRG